ncbi:hypothetical protein EJB05_39733 [Eragrostis curvula]|uniref:CRIB domain-containing protein n=1 Tax=Eragrostis curvula TaxID=38414 RepID=A0A5J9TZN8_9POAL|nr:hypothetical protein EJB05_39733 [Eragrostis curvula]
MSPKGIVPLSATPPMAMKGIFKGLRVVSQIFTVKEREMEIGRPTDVKHVAHIGWGTSTGNASPSWMNDIVASSDLSSFRNFAASTGTSWASQDFDLQPRDASSSHEVSQNNGPQHDVAPCPDVPRPPRKMRRRKPKDGAPTRDSISSAPSAAAAPDTADGTQ